MIKKTPATRGNAHGDRNKTLSPDQLRNTTAPRKVRDQPEGKGGVERDPERDYDGAARKDH